MDDLAQKKCVPCEGGVPALDESAIKPFLEKLPGWSLDDDGKSLFRDFRFKNYYRTIAFVNAIAWMAHRENHHPDLEVGYSHCLVRFTTHAADGLTENDFICASKVEKLLAFGPE